MTAAMSSRQPVRMGIVGIGMYAATYYLPEYSRRKDVLIHAIANRSEAKAYRAARSFDVAHVFTGSDGWKRLVELRDLDAVTICTPNHLHAEIAIAAAQLGKHTLVEKPMATSIEDAEAMIAAARQNAVQLMVSFPYRLLEPVLGARDAVLRGALGRLHGVSSTFGHAGPQQWSPTGRWFFDSARAGGGALLDLGSHQVDLVRWVTAQEFCEVFATCRRLQQSQTVEDNAAMILTMQDGALVSLVSSWTMCPSRGPSLRLFGSGGLVEVRLEDAGPGAKADAASRLVDNVIASIRGDAPCVVGPEDGLRSLEVIEAAYASAAAGKSVRVRSARRP